MAVHRARTLTWTASVLETQHQIDAVIEAPWLASARGGRIPGPPADWQHERDDYFAHPDAIAEEVYHIAHQHPSTWSFDHVIRPLAESWTLN